ncbi:nucleotidyltransferase family protein [Bacillus testis]|uniref:hypothetical protein n=1 Tax=Bacillus testis TaxID=1622072 RepID=UPI00067E81AD|nr:hypothetical protein [Bacillus testis]
MNDVLNKTFKKMSSLDIQCVILRGYLPINDIEESKDIDLFVHPKDEKRVHKLLLDLGWYAPQINTTKFPHRQFFYFTPTKTFKLDIVYDLYFGKEYIKLEKATLVFNKKREIIPHLYGANPYDALTIFMLHLVFDKGDISSESLTRLQRMYEDAKKAVRVEESVYCDLCNVLLPYISKILNDHTNISKSITEVKEAILNTKKLRKCKIVALTFNNKLRIISRIAKVRNAFSKKSICLIGVDGSGKSTTVEKLNELMGEKVTVQYIGFRNYEGKWASKYNTHVPKGVIPNLICTIIVYFEMWKRYLKNRFNPQQIVLFDRFVNESYINTTGLRKIIAELLYRYLFPRPRKIYYLHCDVTTSLARKNDILDKYQFENMKRKFDSQFLEKPDVKTYNSDKMTSDEIAKAIYNDLIKEIPEFLI